MCPHRPLDVLERLRPEILEGEIDAVADMLAHGLGDQHSAGLAQLLQSCRDVDSIAQDVGAVGDHLAEVDPDPKHEAQFRRHGRLPLGDRLLQCDRAQHGVDHRAELDEGAVAGRAGRRGHDVWPAVGRQRHGAGP